MRNGIFLFALMLFASNYVHAGEPGIDRWGSITKIDSLTDQKIVTAGTSDSKGLGIMFQCSNGHYAVILIPLGPRYQMDFITTEQISNVSWRVDNEPAVTEEWYVNSGSGGSPYSLINPNVSKLSDAIHGAKDRLIVRAHGITAVYNLDGASKYIDEAKSQCD